MPYISDALYYENGGSYDPVTGLFEVPVGGEGDNWGSYQYVPLLQIVNDYMLIHADDESHVGRVNRYKVLYHAKRAIQEFSYDAFNDIKVLQLTLSDTLRFVLPNDYVNWVRVNLYENGVLYQLSENFQTLWSDAYLQDNNYRILFDEDGYALKPEFSNYNLDRIDGVKKSLYLNENSPYYGCEGWCVDGVWYFSYPIGGRYGLNTETANANPTFTVANGAIHFSSHLSGKSIILEYISDGMANGDDSQVMVNKMFVEAVYAYITEALMRNRLGKGVQLYAYTQAKRHKRASVANAKIRVSNMKPGMLLMSMRGKDKVIK